MPPSKKQKQIEFFKKQPSAYGGDLLKTRAGRSRPRPLDTRNTMHLVLRSSKARGDWSFVRKANAEKIKEIVTVFSARHGVKIVNMANVGNHLHLQIKISNRYLYPRFIRATTGAIAMAVTGASKNQPMISAAGRQNFWDYRPWTRIVQSYRALLNLRDYMEINRMEGQGYDRIEARWVITGKFPWELRGAP